MSPLVPDDDAVPLELAAPPLDRVAALPLVVPAVELPLAEVLVD
jgi:hypothetical protein